MFVDVFFFRSGRDEDEAQPRADAFVFVQRFQSQRANVRGHRPGRVPDVRRQLRATVASRPVQLRAAAGHPRPLRVAAGHPRLVRAAAGHPRLVRTAAVGRRRTADGRRRLDQQTATVRRRVGAGVRAAEIGHAGRFRGTEQQQRGTRSEQEATQG